MTSSTKLGEKLEADIISLRKELKETFTQLNTKLKFEKSIAILDEILSCQRSPFDNTGLGYDQNTSHEGSNSIM